MNTNTYINGSSFYHKADCRAKFIFTLLLCISIFFSWSVPALFTYVCIALFLSLFSIKLKETFHNIKLILPVIIFMIILLPLQSLKGEPLLSLGTFTLVSDVGLHNLLTVSARFSFVSLITALLLQTSTNTELLLTLRFFRLPYNAALVISLALRFIPSLASVFSDIKESQSLRLPNPEDGEGKQNRLKKILPSLTSVMVYAIKSIPVTASALELRGFSGKGRRSNYHTLKWNGFIFTQILLSVIIPVIFITLLEAVL